MAKKIMTTLLVLLMCTALLCACGSEASTANPPTAETEAAPAAEAAPTPAAKTAAEGP